MKEYSAAHEALAAYFAFPGKVVIDIGSGSGDTVHWLAAQGARVTGLDHADMLARAHAAPAAGGETFVAGRAQRLPFADSTADIILYQASFHHVPPQDMPLALDECRRVLKRGGRAAFIEPVYREGAYSELTRLVEDESEALAKARSAILALAAAGWTMEAEEFFCLQRSFADYRRLVDFFVADASRRPGIVARARKITEELSAAAGLDFDSFRYPSICRLNLARRPLS